ncbi:MAG: multidrug ABC transporter [Bacilli bacterium]|nr:multidrug ABC transporter [Bacilli bacterium]
MNSLFYAGIYLFGIIISSIAQIMLKQAALVKKDSIIKEYLNFKTMLAYFVFFCATLITVFAYKGLPLMYGVLLGTSEYIFVSILSVTILKEKMPLNKIIGLSLVVIGGIIFFI